MTIRRAGNNPLARSANRRRRFAAWVPCGLLCGLVLALLWVPQTADAHVRSMSYASWTLAGPAGSIDLELSLLDRTVLQAGGAATPRQLQRHIQEAVQLIDSEGTCSPQPGSLRRLTAPAGRVRYTWRVRCSEANGPRWVRSELLFDAVPSHVQLASVRREGAATGAEFVLTQGQREAAVPVSSGSEAGSHRSPAAYVHLGIEHIVTGWDHLVFLLALLLLARSLRHVAGAITGFTVGHSATLSLAVLGYTQPDIRAVEALIGLSIALVAAENIWLSRRDRRLGLPIVTVAAIGLSALAVATQRSSVATAVAGVGLLSACSFGLAPRLAHPERLRIAVAALFGLVHGFGFAGALDGLSSSTEQLALSLFSFNLGVELGQLGCVALLWPLLVLLRRRGLQRAAVRWGSAAAAALGTYWFVLRAFS